MCSSSRYIARFDANEARDVEVVGGKGANLGRLTLAGFRVPPGFVVTVGAFAEVIDDAVAGRIASLLAGLDYADPDAVEKAAQSVRDLVGLLAMPGPIAAAITSAYAELAATGEAAADLAGYGSGKGDVYVAVRSSGTAEDLAGNSFAGQHDTYLDVRTADAVLAAVRACWASLWTARAVAYRAQHGFDPAGVRLAVVVQTMVPAAVSGVLFTANPLSTATSEIVVNASWGLGEGIVSGIVTPDQFVLDKATLTVVEHVIGAKQLEVLRDPVAGDGTVSRPVDAARSEIACLSDSRLAELAAIGRDIEQYYDGLPQDVEWAYSGGIFYVLQARDVTGVEFTWDADVDAWQWLPDDRSHIWTRGFADEYWTGAITPLFYSVRARGFTRASERSSALWGFPELARRRRYRYFKGEAYYNVPAQEDYLRLTMPAQLRGGSQLDYLPPSRREHIRNAPFSAAGYLRMHARIQGLDATQGIRGWIAKVEEYLTDKIAQGDGLTDEELRQLTDAALERYLEDRLDFIEGLLFDMWTGFQVHGIAVLYALRRMVDSVFPGDGAMVLADLITGLPSRTATMRENLELWELADVIRQSPALRALFAQADETDFFALLAEDPEGSLASEMYQGIVARHGHRGHADRDFYYPRRAEDPAIDYRSLQVLLTAEGSERPDAQEEQRVRNREAVTEEVLARLRRKPLGVAQARAFATMLGYAHRFLVLRDDQRHYTDRVTYSKKRGFLEVGRRVLERGQIDSPRDFYFLTKDELFALLERRANPRLTAAKIRGRALQFDRFNNKEAVPPQYLQAGQEWVDPSVADEDTEAGGVLAGLPTSRGQVTGQARVIRDLRDIGRLRKGDILVTNSTDPGWTPVFSIIGGLVLETGGMLAHGSCLSREYGLPAATIGRASERIPDGAQITLNGSTGRVTVTDTLRDGQ